MRIGTWNFQSDKMLTLDREAHFQQAMEAIDADVWVITENWTDHCNLPGHRLVSQSSEAPDLESHRRWVAIWSRLDAEPLDVREQADRMTCARIKNPGHKDAVVIGTVLPWHFDRLWPNSEGFARALAIQVTEWKRLTEEAKGSGLVVAGDFNQSLPHRHPYGYRQNETSLNVAMESLDLHCTTLGNDPLSNEPRIDHICIRRSSNVAQVGTWRVPSLSGKPITDHSGAYADIDS